MNVANVRIESFREKSRDTATRIVIVRKTLIRKYNSKKVTFKTQSLKKRKRREREREREREKNLFYACDKTWGFSFFQHFIDASAGTNQSNTGCSLRDIMVLSKINYKFRRIIR